MLVLTRRTDEAIMIGDSIKIIIVDVRKDQVKLGIEAPADIAIHRMEVYEEIQRENRRAVFRGPVDMHRLSELLGRGSKNTKNGSDQDKNPK